MAREWLWSLVAGGAMAVASVFIPNWLQERRRHRQLQNDRHVLITQRQTLPPQSASAPQGSSFAHLSTQDSSSSESSKQTSSPSVSSAKEFGAVIKDEPPWKYDRDNDCIMESPGSSPLSLGFTSPLQKEYNEDRLKDNCYLITLAAILGRSDVEKLADELKFVHNGAADERTILDLWQRASDLSDHKFDMHSFMCKDEDDVRRNVESFFEHCDLCSEPQNTFFIPMGFVPTVGGLGHMVVLRAQRVPRPRRKRNSAGKLVHDCHIHLFDLQMPAGTKTAIKKRRTEFPRAEDFILGQDGRLWYYLLLLDRFCIVHALIAKIPEVQ